MPALPLWGSEPESVAEQSLWPESVVERESVVVQVLPPAQVPVGVPQQQVPRVQSQQVQLPPEPLSEPLSWLPLRGALPFRR